MSQENVEIVREAFRLYASGGVEAVVVLCDDAMLTRRVAPLPDPGPWHGPQGWIDQATEWMRTFDDFKLIADEFIDAGDEVVVRVDQEARGHGSGVPVTASFWFVYRLRNRKIVALDMFGSRDQALEAVGLRE